MWLGSAFIRFITIFILLLIFAAEYPKWAGVTVMLVTVYMIVFIVTLIVGLIRTAYVDIRETSDYRKWKNRPKERIEKRYGITILFVNNNSTVGYFDKKKERDSTFKWLREELESKKEILVFGDTAFSKDKVMKIFKTPETWEAGNEYG